MAHRAGQLSELLAAEFQRLDAPQRGAGKIRPLLDGMVRLVSPAEGPLSECVEYLLTSAWLHRLRDTAVSGLVQRPPVAWITGLAPRDGAPGG
jgi:hypothetical protein